MYIRRGIDYLRESFERRSAKIVRKLHPVSFIVHFFFFFNSFFFFLILLHFIPYNERLLFLNSDYMLYT